MIPQSVKELVASENGTGFYQTLALILFMIFFIGIILYTLSRSKNYYRDAANAPLEGDENDQNLL